MTQNNNYISKIFDGNEFLQICKSDDVFEGKGRQILFDEDDDFQVAVFRIKGKLYALDNICPHRHADRIFEGIIQDMTVMCPLHGWTYSIETGQNVDLSQGIKSLNSHEVFESEGYVYLKKPQFELPVWRR